MSNENEEYEDNVAMIALGDQIQQVCQDSSYPVALIVIVGEDGTVEVRSGLPYEVIKNALVEVGENF